MSSHLEQREINGTGLSEMGKLSRMPHLSLCPWARLEPHRARVLLEHPSAVSIRLFSAWLRHPACRPKVPLPDQHFMFLFRRWLNCQLCAHTTDTTICILGKVKVQRQCYHAEKVFCLPPRRHAAAIPPTAIERAIAKQDCGGARGGGDGDGDSGEEGRGGEGRREGRGA